MFILQGFCNEIYNLKCERTCMESFPNNTAKSKFPNSTPHLFKNLGKNTGKETGKNALIFNGETVVAVR